MPLPIVGLDLSLTAPAAICIPGAWDGRDLSAIVVSKLGSEARGTPGSDVERIARMSSIAVAVVAFVAKQVPFAYEDRDGWQLPPGLRPLVYVEGYAFGARSSSAHALAELGGIVRVDLFRDLGLTVTPVVASSARKTLLQKLPRADLKKFVERNMRRLQGETYYWSGDVIDAFAVGNHARMLNGWRHMSFPGV